VCVCVCVFVCMYVCMCVCVCVKDRREGGGRERWRGEERRWGQADTIKHNNIPACLIA